MRYMGRTLHPEFTDLAVVVGPYARWTEDDYEDLQKERPEVLLGYRVRLMTEHDVMDGRLRGLRPMKIVVLDSSQYRKKHWMMMELWLYLEYVPWAKIEHWYVHRLVGIHKIAG